MLMLLAPLKRLTDVNAPLQRGLAAAESVFGMIDAPAEEDRGTVALPRARGEIAYEGVTPVGWVSLGPRAEFGRLQRSPVTKPVDDRPVWSIVCFFIPGPHRGKGVGKALLGAAVDFARSQGAEALEGYPIHPTTDRMPDVYAWTGLASMFEQAGFVEISRPKPTRPIYRRSLRSSA